MKEKEDGEEEKEVSFAIVVEFSINQLRNAEV